MSINRKASKKHSEFVEVEDFEKRTFERYVSYYGEDRLTKRLLKGRKIKPCGRECREYGIMIAKSFDHGSFVNFKELMDDKDFLLEIAKITPNPTECANYFYLYINPYLKKDEQFRYDLLKAIYKNENVYKLEDIKVIVEFCNLEKENKKIKSDENVKLMLEDRLYQLDNGYGSENERFSSVFETENKSEQTYADINDLRDNIRRGLKEIIETFEPIQMVEETLDDLRDSIEIKFF